MNQQFKDWMEVNRKAEGRNEALLELLNKYKEYDRCRPEDEVFLRALDQEMEEQRDVLRDTTDTEVLKAIFLDHKGSVSSVMAKKVTWASCAATKSMPAVKFVPSNSLAFEGFRIANVNHCGHKNHLFLNINFQKLSLSFKNNTDFVSFLSKIQKALSDDIERSSLAQAMID